MDKMDTFDTEEEVLKRLEDAIEKIERGGASNTPELREILAQEVLRIDGRAPKFVDGESPEIYKEIDTYEGAERRKLRTGETSDGQIRFLAKLRYIRDNYKSD